MGETRPNDARISLCVEKVIEAEQSLAVVRQTLSTLHVPVYAEVKEKKALELPRRCEDSIADLVHGPLRASLSGLSGKDEKKASEPSMPSRFPSSLPEVMSKESKDEISQDVARTQLAIAPRVDSRTDGRSWDMQPPVDSRGWDMQLRVDSRMDSRGWDTNNSRFLTGLSDKSRSNWGSIDNSHALKKHQATLDQVIIDALDHPPAEEAAGWMGNETILDGRSSTAVLKRNSFVRKAFRRAGRKYMPQIRRCAMNHILWVKLGNCSWPMIHPEAKFRLLWMTVGFWFITYEAFIIPYNMAFSTPNKPIIVILTGTINIFFMTDVLLTFMTALMQENGHIEARPHIIARRYISGWFLPDCLSAIPWEWLQSSGSGVGGAEALTRGFRFIRAFRLLRLTRLVHMMKLKRTLDKAEAYIESSRGLMFSMGLVRIFLIIFGITHWGACVWYIVGSSDNEVTWISSHMPPDIVLMGQRYVYCLYFTLTTMTTVGYGDITPENYQEVLYALLLLLVASVVFAGQMGTLTDLISSMNYHNRAKSEKKMALSRYMRWRAVPHVLTMTIRQHMIFLWDTNEGHDSYEEYLKTELPPILKTELCYHIYGQILANAPFLTFMKDYQICLKQLCCMVQSIFLTAGDIIFRNGDVNEQIYMLLSGRVWMSRNESLFDSYMQPHGASNFNSTLELCDKDAFRIPRRNDGQTLATISSKLTALTKKPPGIRRYKSLASMGDKEHAPTENEKTAENIFQAEAFVHAATKLKDRDMEEHDAAVLVQRRWRKRHAKRMRKKAMDPQKFDGVSGDRHMLSGLSNGNNLSLNHLHSKCLNAPAYLGESCLWTPFAEWAESEPSKYMYSAQCMDRCEFVYVARSSIAELLDHFAPWLITRFEVFREEVVSTMKTFAAAPKTDSGAAVDTKEAEVSKPAPESNGMERSSSKQHKPAGPDTPPPHLVKTPAMPPNPGAGSGRSSVGYGMFDWTAADTDMPQDDVSINAHHRRVLSRGSGNTTPVTPWNLRDARKQQEDSNCCGNPMVVTGGLQKASSRDFRR